MKALHLMNRFSLLAFAVLLFASTVVYAGDHASAAHTSSVFKGKVVNGGTVMHYRQGGQSMLKLSEEFEIPGTPDPHWQLVDSAGGAYLVQALKVKDGLSNREIVLPAYVPDVARVQIWCAFAQVLLGEADFPSPVK